MRRYLLFISILIFAQTLNADVASLKRVQAHLLLQDFQSAVTEARKGVSIDPSHQALWEAYIAALGKIGNEPEMLIAWKNYSTLNDKPFENRQLMEKMAWAVIDKGSMAPSPIIRIFAVLGAFFGQDSHGVELIYKHLQDKSAHVRAVAVQLAGHLRDAKLLDGLHHLLQSEKSWAVKQEVIKALGKMKDKTVQPQLMGILTNEASMAEEKATAIQALLEILESVTPAQLQALAHSSRSGLRELACRAVIHLTMKESTAIIEPLINDNCSPVRIASLQAFGVIRYAIDEKVLLQKIADADPRVGITATWLLTLQNAELGKSYFKKWLNHPRQEIRLYGAAALVATGKYGISIALEQLQVNSDPYVQLNLALGLIGQRIETEKASDIVYHILKTKKEKWMQLEEGVFHAFVPASLKKNEELLENSETTNQLLRLEILNKLAIVKYRHAQEAMIELLLQKEWGITGTVSALLLTEGDETAIELVRSLLNHPNYRIRVQAGLILAMWGKDENVIGMLQKVYLTADRELKEKILEGLARVSSEHSIPFLIDQLNEPAQSLRIIAAAALLQCLYH